jgi:predicted small lipoprotein YifL
MGFSKASAVAAVVLATLAALAGCGPAGINGPVDVPPGATVDSATTVNGPVNVGDGAKVGSAATVNGSVQLGDNVTAASAKTVNGGIKVGSNTKVSEDVITVNGGIQLATGADVNGKLVNVNGDVRLSAAHVGGGITTVNGDIEVGKDSRVEGGIRIEKPEFSMDPGKDMPRVVIGPGAIVDGPLKFEREVKLYVSDTAKIGPVEGATPQMFSGESPDGATSAASTPGKPHDAPPGAGAGPEKE